MRGSGRGKVGRREEIEKGKKGNETKWNREIGEMRRN